MRHYSDLDATNCTFYDFTFGNKSLTIFFIFNRAYFSSTNNNVIPFDKKQN